LKKLHVRLGGNTELLASASSRDNNIRCLLINAVALGRGQFRFQNLSVRHEGAEADLIASVGDVNVTYTESYIPWIINPKKRLTEPIVVEKLSVSNVSTVLFDAIEHQEKRRRTGSAKVLPNVQLKDITLTVRAIKICIVASSSYQSVQTLQNINIDLWDRATGELVLSSASNDVQKLPQIHIDSFNCFKPISLQNIAFDAFLRANASGRVGSRGKFSISEGRSCTERQLVAADIPIEAAFARFLFFPLNLVSQASLDFEMTSSPVRKHDDGSHDYMYGAKLVLRDFKIQSGEVSTEDQRLKRSGLNLATVEILRRYMKTQENTQIPVEFDIVMNEKDHQPEKFVSAIASAFVTRGAPRFYFINSLIKRVLIFSTCEYVICNCSH
jgi:hypothetical protein